MISGVGSALDHVIVLVDAKAPRALHDASPNGYARSRVGFVDSLMFITCQGVHSFVLFVTSMIGRSQDTIQRLHPEGSDGMI